ncbi:MAG TPA: ATP-dependent metallopeptidase FtsH/Yme1/Tma family protein, partial [Thermoanaerobaculia bacterium]|nr:ATP-dependent metallopeptidase FtsH/Yme1/Tma family protein [Thermoanaerobaculia bacterium]
MNSTVKTLFLWMAIFVVVILLWQTFQGGKANKEELSFTAFMEKVRAGKVAEVTITDQGEVTGKFKGGA